MPQPMLAADCPPPRAARPPPRLPLATPRCRRPAPARFSVAGPALVLEQQRGTLHSGGAVACGAWVPGMSDWGHGRGARVTFTGRPAL
jgi:hypothetical protein